MGCEEPFNFDDAAACKPLPILPVNKGKGKGKEGKGGKGKGKNKGAEGASGPNNRPPRTVKLDAWTAEAKVERALEALATGTSAVVL